MRRSHPRHGILAAERGLRPRGRLLFRLNYAPAPELHTLSLHDALPIFPGRPRPSPPGARARTHRGTRGARSEEHTSELQSLTNLVCRLLLEKKIAGIRALWSEVLDARDDGHVHQSGAERRLGRSVAEAD